MVLATHVIFTAYGFWLPNDPRGSWSNFVAAWELVLAGGRATTVGTPRSLAHDEHDVQARLRAKSALTYPPVRFDGVQALTISKGFRKAIDESDYKLYACSIMPDHVHAVVERHEQEARRIVGHLKARASQALIERGRHPFGDQVLSDGTLPTPWVRNCWRVFLDSREDIDRAIEYVEQNPVKEGLKRQAWSFVMAIRG